MSNAESAMADSFIATDTASPSRHRLGLVLERWHYVLMATLFFVTALVGFIPDSFTRLAAIEAGTRQPFGPFVHVHAVTMGAWLVVLLSQSWLDATGQRRLHRRLGIASAFIALAVLATMIAVTVEKWGPALATQGASSTGAEINNLSRILLNQLRAIILFSAFVAWALWARKADPASHKRLWILATLVLIPAAINRMHWLPHTLPQSPLSTHIYMLLLLAPALVIDIIRRGRPHRTYVIGMAVILPFIFANHAFHDSAWWRSFVPRMMSLIV